MLFAWAFDESDATTRVGHDIQTSFFRLRMRVSDIQKILLFYQLRELAFFLIFIFIHIYFMYIFGNCYVYFTDEKAM